jgi:sugar-specific transcriptional regulator TrmB
MKILCSDSDFLEDISANSSRIAYIIHKVGVKEGIKELIMAITKSIKMASIGEDIFFEAQKASINAIDRNKFDYFSTPHTKSDIQDFVKTNLL